MGLCELDCLVQNRYRWRALVNAVMNISVPQIAGKLMSGCTTGGHSSSAQLQSYTYYIYICVCVCVCVCVFSLQSNDVSVIIRSISSCGDANISNTLTMHCYCKLTPRHYIIAAVSRDTSLLVYSV
jgi:hypothetical protein